MVAFTDAQLEAIEAEANGEALGTFIRDRVMEAIGYSG